MNGMRHSIITSPTINAKDRMEGRLYSLTDASNLLINSIHFFSVSVGEKEEKGKMTDYLYLTGSGYSTPKVSTVTFFIT